MKMIPVRLGIQQRVLPSYRTDFFDRLAAQCQNGCSVFAGMARREEMLSKGELKIAQYTLATNIHIMSGRYYLCWQKGLIHWLAGVDPDVVIMEGNPRYIHSMDGIRWLHQHDKKAIGWGLGAPQKPHGGNNLVNMLKKKMLTSYDLMITYSNKGKEEYIKLGYPEEKIFVAPNAVAAKPNKLPKRVQKRFENEQPTILYVGRLQARKRIDLLIEACARLKDELNPRLWIVGDGPVRDDLEKIASMQFPDVEFFGSVYGEDLEKYFSASDLFVLPGTGGLAVQQAMAHALPVIVAEADGTQVDLVKKNNGWNVEPGDLENLVDTIRTALNDPERLRQMGAESYKIIRDEVNLDKMLSTFINAISTALEGSL